MAGTTAAPQSSVRPVEPLIWSKEISVSSLSSAGVRLSSNTMRNRDCPGLRAMTLPSGP